MVGAPRLRASDSALCISNCRNLVVGSLMDLGALARNSGCRPKYCRFCFQFSLSDFIEDWMCVIGVEAAGGMAIKIRSSNVFPDVQDKNRRLAQRLSLFQALELNL